MPALLIAFCHSPFTSYIQSDVFPLLSFTFSSLEFQIIFSQTMPVEHNFIQAITLPSPICSIIFYYVAIEYFNNDDVVCQELVSQAPVCRIVGFDLRTIKCDLDLHETELLTAIRNPSFYASGASYNKDNV